MSGFVVAWLFCDVIHLTHPDPEGIKERALTIQAVRKNQLEKESTYFVFVLCYERQ